MPYATLMLQCFSWVTGLAMSIRETMFDILIHTITCFGVCVLEQQNEEAK